MNLQFYNFSNKNLLLQEKMLQKCLFVPFFILRGLTVPGPRYIRPWQMVPSPVGQIELAFTRIYSVCRVDKFSFN